MNQRLARVQTVKSFAILPAELSIDGGGAHANAQAQAQVDRGEICAVIEQLYRDSCGLDRASTIRLPTREVANSQHSSD